jgi:GTP cyclohydrolase I
MQVQERLTDQIKDCIQEALEPLGVAVVIEAQHMCMQMRGIEKQILYHYLFLPEHLKK